MKILFEKFILLILCMFFFYSHFTTSEVLLYSTLITVSCASFQLAFTKPQFSYWITICFFILGYFFSPILFFFPVIVYNWFLSHDKKIIVIGFVLQVAASILVPSEVIGYYFFANGCSFYFAQMSYLYAIQNRNLHTLRDNSIETNRLLQEKNRIIIEQQNDLINATRLRERNRIAREIHDNVGHMLTRSILQLGALKTMNKDKNLSPLFENLLTTLNSSMTSIRNSVHDLHDNSIDLKQAITSLFDQVDQRFQIKFEYSMSQTVPKEIKYNFISIVKEGLTNACKYSNGSIITLVMIEHPGLYQLMLEDNGTSISMEKGQGIGLMNMKDRIASINGTFKISTDNGFRIFISVMKQKDKTTQNADN